MKKRDKKNILIYLTAILICTFLINNKNKKISFTSEVETISEPFTTYSGGNIYVCDDICKARCLNQVCNDRDVVIVDQRDFTDPNFKILSSYRITDRSEMREIIDIIKDYSKGTPSNWDRSIDAMENEWIIHNICSSLCIKRSSTNDVDFNNGDESIYGSKIISKILGK